MYTRMETETITGRREHARTSSLPVSPALWPGAGRSRKRSGNLSAQQLATESQNDKTTNTYQVVEGEVLQLSRLNPKILEGLGRGVDSLVDEFPLDLIGGDGGPPEVLVQVVSQSLEGTLGQVQVTTALDDFTVHELGNLSGRVVLGTVELIGLTRSGVVVKHVLESSANIRGLDWTSAKHSTITCVAQNILREQARSAPACGWR